MSYELAQQFLTMVRQRKVAYLDPWLASSVASGIAELQHCAAGLHQAYNCVRAALTEGWSTGLVEDHINRVKLVKRQMFGRAKSDLLRQRVSISRMTKHALDAVGELPPSLPNESSQYNQATYHLRGNCI